MRVVMTLGFSPEWFGKRWSRIAGTVLAAFVLSVSATSSPAAQQTEGLFEPRELIELLAGGGLILYVRHAATDHSQSDQDISDLSKCELQRNLSRQGKNDARTMRATIEKYKIPIGTVLTSPYCRAIDTASIAFGRYTVVHDLRATFFTSSAETEAINRRLRMLLAETPIDGTNTVLVGHTANLSDVTYVWPKPEGVVHVFRPLGSSGFEHLGRVTPEDWRKLLSEKEE